LIQIRACPAVRQMRRGWRRGAGGKAAGVSGSGSSEQGSLERPLAMDAQNSHSDAG
jgi:hypothetical protein